MLSALTTAQHSANAMYPGTAAAAAQMFAAANPYGTLGTFSAA